MPYFLSSDGPLPASIYQNLGTLLSWLLLGLVTYLSTTAANYFNRRAYSRRMHHNLPVSHQNDIEINVLLDRLREAVRAQRVYLTRFHNGDHYSDGGEVVKKTRTHERVRRGVAYQAEIFAGMVTSTLGEEMTLVIQEGAAWTVVASLPDCKFKWLCLNGGVTAVARCAIRKKGSIIGFVGADWDDPSPVQPAYIEQICPIAGEIGVILANIVPR